MWTGRFNFRRVSDGRTMLIDGGGLAGSEWVGGQRSGTDVGEEVVSPYLWSRGLKKLDVVALTHADHDHLDGLYAVLDNFRVGALWVGEDDARPAFTRLLAEAKSRGVSIVHRAQGADFDWHGALVMCCGRRIRVCRRKAMTIRSCCAFPMARSTFC